MAYNITFKQHTWQKKKLMHLSRNRDFGSRKSGEGGGEGHMMFLIKGRNFENILREWVHTMEENNMRTTTVDGNTHKQKVKLTI